MVSPAQLTDLDLANLCAATYWDTSQFDEIFFGGETNDVWVGLKHYDDFDVVAFRGSTTIQDWFRDFQGCMIDDPELGAVEKGFMAGMRDTFAALKPHLKFPCYVTGHSLGAARALIFSALCTIKVSRPRPVVFGCPRPGGDKLRNILRSMNGRSYRNRWDPVTEVPLAVPPFFMYCQPYELTALDEVPNVPDIWGPLSDHHIQLYQKGLEKLYVTPSSK